METTQTLTTILQIQRAYEYKYQATDLKHVISITGHNFVFACFVNTSKPMQLLCIFFHFVTTIRYKVI